MKTTHALSRPGRTIPAGRIAAALLVAGGLAATVSLTGASASAQAHSTKRVTISTFKSAKVGTILSDSRTLYTLRPGAVACTAACHKIWIPVLLPKGVMKASAGAGVSAARLGVKTIAGGGRQVTYGGRALFWFFEDTAAGQVNGNVTDKWGKWVNVVLVKPAGKPTTTTTKPPNTTTTAPNTTTTQPPTTTSTVPGGGGGVGF
jgi:predicted lipoprotein with Yx(FWY)xxD motif